MNNSNNNIDVILHKLNKTGNKETNFLLIKHLLNLLVLISFALLSASLLELLAHGDITFRGILLFSSLTTALGFGGYYLYPVLLRALGIKYKPTAEQLALRVGAYYTDLSDKLCNSIQLLAYNDKFEGTSKSLTNAAFENIYHQSVSKDFDKIIESEKIRKSIILSLSMIGFVLILFFAFNSSLGASLLRVVNWNKSYIPPAPFALSIEPKSISILRGESLKISIKSVGKHPENVNLYIKEIQQDKFDKYTLKLDKDGNCSYELNSIKNSFVYYADAPWLNESVITDEYQITVTEKPLIKTISGKIISPSYSGIISKLFDEKSADITVLRGSRVDFRIQTNKTLKSADLIFESINVSANLDSNTQYKADTVRVNLKAEGSNASGGININKSGIYYFQITDIDNQKNTDPIKYTIAVLSDEYPTISLDEPQMDVQVNEQALLPVKVSISDDYGFSGLKLFYRLIESKYSEPDEKFSSINLPFQNQGLNIQVPYLWELNKVNIAPEDKYEFYVEVYDNDKITGPKSSKSHTLTVRLPSLDEVLRTADGMQDKIEKEAEKIIKKAEEVKKEVEQMNRELIQKPKGSQMDWKDKKKAEDILKKQSDLQEKMADLQKNIEDMAQKLDENKALSPETMQKYMELQKLMQEVSSPELKKMQEMMQKAFEKMSPEEMQKAIKNAKFDEEQFKKSIERTMNMLKRLKVEQKIDALTKRAEELSKKQDELNKDMENSNPNNSDKNKEMSKEQKDIKDELKNISEDLKDLEKMMKELKSNMPMDELNTAKEELKKEETSAEMQESQESMEKGDFKKASKSQKQASKNLKNFADQMQKMKQKMEDKVNKEVKRKMEKAVNDMLELSKAQEELKEATQNTDNNSSKMPDLADKQQEIMEGLENVANNMMELSQKSFAVTPEMGAQFGMGLQAMSQAMQQLGNRQTHNAMQSQMQSMAAMNKAASQMEATLSMMQKNNGSCNNPGGTGQGSSGSGQSFGQKLQQLAGQQQGINGAMKQMGSGQDGQLSPEQQSELGRIAKQQGLAQKTLEDLANEQKQFGNGERRSLGDLNNIAKEMKEVMTDMQSGNITPETLRRQEKILSRLLDASISMNERDYEKKRESNTGKNILRKSPNGLELDKQLNKDNQLDDLLKSIQQGYTKDYETLIRKYLEMIQSNQGIGHGRN